jgi:uncharacterized glyoxalase superfamily protein PhnB
MMTVWPQLRYDDPIGAVPWLCRVFGFTEESRMTGPDGTLYIADLRTPLDARVMVSGRPSFLKDHMRTVLADSYRAATDEGWPNLSYSITVLVPDVDAHFTHARREGAQVIAEPRDQPWGLRDYEAVDLEGRVWNFSQPAGQGR